MSQTTRLSALNSTIKTHPDASQRELGRLLFTTFPALFPTEQAAYSVVRRQRNSKFHPQPVKNTDVKGAFNEKTGMLTTRSANITTLAAALEFAKVDLNDWEVDKHEINFYEVTMGADSSGTNRPETMTNCQVKVWLKRRKQVVEKRKVFDEMLKSFHQSAPAWGKIHPPKKDGLLFEVDIFDPHFGKLSWEKETEHNYDLAIAKTQYGAALDGLISRASGFDIGRILYVVGNDFFHVDNGENTTTKGTAQDCDGRWQKAFVEGRRAVVDSILKLNQIAPVDVLMVSGNHDEEKVFYLGEVLAGIFGNTKGVTVDNSPKMRKYFHWGASLIGFTHGNCEKHANLPLIMATEQPKLWAASKFREFHIGHYHRLKTMSFLPVEEMNTIRVRTLSSLTPPDAWHKKMGYEGLKSANGFLWDEHEGLVATVNHQVK
jgi:hypothetical protein